MADRTGQQLGSYRLIRSLGRGGQAEVYLGEHIYLRRQVAIKILGAQMDLDDEKEFLREGQIVAALMHPHIVRIFDFGIESLSFRQRRVYFQVMEYAPEGTLRNRHPRGSVLSIATVISYVRQIADALQYAHDHRIVHRDVKPENMLIHPDGSILLSDFGIAIPAHGTASQISLPGAGTFLYTAPEQWKGKPVRASDQYALGIVVYEWLSGRLPFSGYLHEILSQHVQAPPPPLRSKVPNISEAVEAVVMRALAKDPKDRFPTIQDFAQALEQASAPILGQEGDSMIESSLHDVASQEQSNVSVTQPFSEDPQNRRDRLSASDISTILLGPKDRNDLIFPLPNSTLTSERTSPLAMQSDQQNISSQGDHETLGSIKLPPEQTEAIVDPLSPNIPQYDFFISYNKADRDKAMWIAHYVQQAGYSVHVPPQDFRMNFVFINEMNKAFKQAKHMIVVLSPTYIKALKSRRGGFNNFKRATSRKQETLFSICVDSSASISKELSKIENHIDLTEESDTMIEGLLLAYISGQSINLSTSGVSLNSLNYSSVTSAPPVPSKPQGQNNPVPPPTQKHIVLLVHGIRTHGPWQEMVAANLETQDSIQVIPLRYGYFDALRFWFPFLTRKKVIERVLRDIRTTCDVHRDSHLSIIAHSFGTYTIAKILEDNPDIRIYRLILCGSVLNTDFRWDKLQNRIEGYQAGTNAVINECGTRDLWPILARISTWGYGSAGSFGFGSPIVTDRYHDYHHGDYFSPQFVRKYWVPFIEQGVITNSNWGPEIPWWKSVLSLFPLRYIIVLVIILPLFLAGLLFFHR